MVTLGKGFPNCGYNFELRQGVWQLSGVDAKLYEPRAFHWEFSIYPAVPELETERHDGFMSHLLDLGVIKKDSRALARRLNTPWYQRKAAESPPARSD